MQCGLDKAGPTNCRCEQLRSAVLYCDNYRWEGELDSEQYRGVLDTLPPWDPPARPNASYVSAN